MVLGLRPTFTGPTTVTSARTSAPAVEPAASTTLVTPTEPVVTTLPDTTAEPVPDVLVPPEVTAAVPATPDTTVAPVATAPPATAKATTPTTKSKGKSSTKTPATTAPAAPAPSASDQVMAYYDASNARGRCVAHQPSKSTQAQVMAACGPAPAPPANLLQYWAARDTWNACADPFYEKGWGTAQVESACGPQPQRSQYGVPINPYSKSQG